MSYGQSGNFFKFVGGDSNGSRGITLRAGAQLSAAEVLMVVGSPFGQGITIEAGAGISTLGRGKTPFDSRDGFVYQPGYMDESNSGSMLAVSNGWLAVLPMAASARGPQPILVGVCGAAGCEGQTQLYAEGTLAFATNKRFELDNRERFGRAICLCRWARSTWATRADPCRRAGGRQACVGPDAEPGRAGQPAARRWRAARRRWKT